MTRRQTRTRAHDESSNKPLEPVTEQQQRFIETLLLGHNVTDTARLVGISRRTACYWLCKDNPVRWEYDKQRAVLTQQFRARVTRLHDLAFSALEDMLSPKTPPFIRMQAVKLIYESQLKQHCHVVAPQRPHALLQNTIERTWAERKQETEFAIQAHVLEDE